MSLPTRIALSIAGACIIGGLALLATALTMVDGDLASLSRPTAPTERTYAAPGSDVSTITLREQNTAVELIESPDDQVHLSYIESEKDFYDIDLSNSGALTITYRDGRRWFERIIDFSFNRGRPTVLAVPAGYLGNVSLSTSNATISSPAASMQGELTLRTSNGRVELNQMNLDGPLRINTSNGAVQLRQVAATSVTVQTSNGAVTANDVTTAAETFLRTTNGHISVASITAGTTIELRTSNGRVEGTIDDQMALFSISSRASNGNNNLPESWAGGPKDLLVTTSNGRIDLRFLR